MSSPFQIGYFLVLVSFLSGAAITFDRLVSYERRYHPGAWEQDGRPSFGVPGGAAWKRCLLAWLIVTPGWVRPDVAATRLLMAYRIWFGALIVGMLLGMVLRTYGISA
jgi:hypothetical protein